MCIMCEPDAISDGQLHRLLRGGHGVATHAAVGTAAAIHFLEPAAQHGLVFGAVVADDAPDPAGAVGNHAEDVGHERSSPGSSVRIASHHFRRGASRGCEMSASRVRLTSRSGIAPTLARASSSVWARAIIPDSRCPSGALAPMRAHLTKNRYAPQGGDCVASSSARISTLYENPSEPSNAAGRSCTAMKP